MRNQDIRKKFLEFFESKSHAVEHSAPMVLKNDPTLMFTNAGMNQFKDVFLGNKEPKVKRIANSQKCLRVSGKHNDLEEVGIDTYHHTMFEMLGNWSFGDYFKEEAIAWSWELLTEVFKIPKDNIYVSIFSGDEKDGLQLDQEAKDIWKKFIAEDRILAFDKKDNFWEMGETGPCGPCSEIHVDLRSAADKKTIDGRSLVNMDDPLVIEIWNLVFMQYMRKADGSLEPLKYKHIDTGMGFERLCMALQGVQSNYDTDVFVPYIKELEKRTKHTYGNTEDEDIAFRVIADHLRAVAFAICDGQLPSNNGAGYVIRRILRRAVSYGYRFLSQKEPFIYELVTVLVKEMGAAFPELVQQQNLIFQVIKEEEQSFLRTLKQGLERVNKLIEESKKQDVKTLSGEAVFELHDTFGFPTDLTALVAKKSAMQVDLEGFERIMQERKAVNRKDANRSVGDWIEVHPEAKETFVGYASLRVETRIKKYRTNTSKKGKEIQVVLEQTPFYAESGGQVGDKGELLFKDQQIKVYDTKKENDLIVHFVNELPKSPDQKCVAQVDEQRRSAIVKNHSATHLLHHALREVLGDHVEQRGSYVGPDRLRFDFSHFSKTTTDELNQIAAKVAEQINAGISLEEKRDVPISEAKKMGAMALFGEKYGDSVRVIKFADSVELCGGCHVVNTKEIGYFLLESESSVASGIRRIEALTGSVAIDKLEKDSQTLESILTLLKNPQKPIDALEKIVSTNSEAQKRIEFLENELAQKDKNEWVQRIEKSAKGFNQLIIESKLAPAQIKTLLFQLKEEQGPLFALVASDNNGKPTISILVSESITEQYQELHAGKLVKELAKHIKGGGGGQAFFATAGGKDVSGIPNVLETINKRLE